MKVLPKISQFIQAASIERKAQRSRRKRGHARGAPALLEADVNYKVAKDFTNTVTERAVALR